MEQTEMTPINLLPCPFCGGTPAIQYPERDYASWAVVVCKCGIEGYRIPFQTYYNCEGSVERDWKGQEAAEAWNRRAVAAPRGSIVTNKAARPDALFRPPPLRRRIQ